MSIIHEIGVFSSSFDDECDKSKNDIENKKENQPIYKIMIKKYLDNHDLLKTDQQRILNIISLYDFILITKDMFLISSSDAFLNVCKQKLYEFYDGLPDNIGHLYLVELDMICKYKTLKGKPCKMKICNERMCINHYRYDKKLKNKITEYVNLPNVLQNIVLQYVETNK
jgi:hypothetical protein